MNVWVHVDEPVAELDRNKWREEEVYEPASSEDFRASISFACCQPGSIYNTKHMSNVHKHKNYLQAEQAPANLTGEQRGCGNNPLFASERVDHDA